ncbi:MAG: ATP-dependent Clp protease adaptor ClpS [Bacteroidales bacterium]|nr:ATP-dependent Clp protease adaptor ClpS [Bacteroidales bacterium]
MKEKEYSENQQDFEEIVDGDQLNKRFLILHNDDTHTFDYVIDSLIEICKLEPEQAEQCTYIIHYKGKCDVKKGSLEYLRPLRKGLTKKGLNATID